MNSGFSMVDEQEESEPRDVVTNRRSIVGLTAQSPELPKHILRYSSFATDTLNTHEVSQSLYGDVVKEEHELVTFKSEADEALNIKEENVDYEEESGNAYKTSNLGEVSNVDGDVNVRPRSITYSSGGDKLIYVKYEFTVPITQGIEESIIKEKHKLETFKTEESLNENTITSYTLNVDIPIKECFVVLRRLDEFLNYTSGSTTKKPKSESEESKNFSKLERRHLNKHMRIRTGEKQFRCSVCTFSTAYKRNLTVHSRIHADEKPFSCNVCDYSAVQQETLNNHMRTHSGEKLFQCNVCEYSAVHKQTLINHKRTHTGEKPFRCNVCDLRLTRKESLVRHMRTHTGEKPFRCSTCEFRTAHQSSLITHMRIHTDEKPFRCNICEFSAAHGGNLIRHMQKHN